MRSSRIARAGLVAACFGSSVVAALLVACESEENASSCAPNCGSGDAQSPAIDSSIPAIVTDAAAIDSAAQPDAESHEDSGTDAAQTKDDGGVIVPIATGLAYPWHMAIGGGYVYVVDGGGLEKVAISGGAVTTTDIGSGIVIGTDATNVYWATISGDVYQQPHAGGAKKKIGSGVALTINSISSDGTYVYWTEYLFGGRVKRIPVNADAVTVAEDASPALDYPAGVAFAGGSVFVAENAGNLDTGTISRLLPDGGATAIISNRTKPSFPVSDGTRIFWWEDIGSYDAVRSILTDGSNLQTYTTSAIHPTLATDGTSIYYVNASGGIGKAPVAGGNASTLYAFGYTCEALAVDGTSVYWADYDNGFIYKAPK